MTDDEVIDEAAKLLDMNPAVLHVPVVVNLVKQARAARARLGYEPNTSIAEDVAYMIIRRGAV